ncbi:alpha/beta-hydrolase [Macroventuria anomochaeta]|uniref:Alpha/beta-hydrolase n=1 Tax=Macroventuria anomochaeta TaxID=301207 RepID=A0ACB6RIQ4_9PLEO|nr:alpha/beta-hydrolase [Macroventuria anomochaeta]KAF2621295.1 alpha/beta-hydrolase [Macroventuria anomochaeta]
MAPTLKALATSLFAGYAAARQCQTLSIPVDISSRQGVFKKVPVETNLDASAFATRFNEFQYNYTAELFTGFQTLQKSIKISAQYCTPDGGSNGIVQVLSHGIGFDKTYWDLSYDDYKYSYVNVATASGYSTLAIDRFGIGNSTHGDPFNEIQAQAEVEALNEVTKKLRVGSISEISCSYEKVVHVGHSFGSVQTFWLSALYPNNTNGVVLTGYSNAAEFFPYIVAGWNLHSARLNQPFRFGNASATGVQALAQQYGVQGDIVPGLTAILNKIGVDVDTEEVRQYVASTEINDLINGYNHTIFQYNYPSGYFAHSALTALQYAFLFPDQFDVGLAVESEKTKQPVTAGEIMTIGNAPKVSQFTGPAFVITGQYDVPFCGGNCYGQAQNITAANIPAGVKTAFPAASAFEAYIQPNTGHGLNFHYNATAGYQIIQDFLGRNGLST